MSIVTFQEIYEGLEDKLLSVTGLPERANTNGTIYKPTIKTPYYRDTFLPSESQVMSIGADGYDRKHGLYQIDLLYPRTDGVLNSLAKADLILNAFYRGTIIFTTNGVITIERSWPLAGTQYEAWWMQPVVIRWSCYKDR